MIALDSRSERTTIGSDEVLVEGPAGARNHEDSMRAGELGVEDGSIASVSGASSVTPSSATRLGPRGDSRVPAPKPTDPPTTRRNASIPRGELGG